MDNNLALRGNPHSAMFDPLEFDNQNDNPFEIAERATLNELDELRSVLEPDNQSINKVIKSAPENQYSDKEDFELSSIFSKPIVTNVDDTCLPTSQLISVTENATPGIQGNAIYSNGNFTAIPQQPHEGTLNWADFASPPSNPFTTNNPFHPNFRSIDDSNAASEPHLSSKTPPPNFGYREISTHQNQEQLEENIYANINMGSLHKTKSLPNLADSMHDYENTEQITLNNNHMPGVVKYQSDSDSPQSHMIQQPVATGRLENIMKQYQFQRIPQTSSSNTQLPMNNRPSSYIDSSVHHLYDAPPSRDDYNQGSFPIHSTSNTLSGVMIPPVYMPPQLGPNNDYVNIVPNPSGMISNNIPNSSFDNYSSSGLESGPRVVNSRLPTSNTGPYIGSSDNTTNSVINLNPDTRQQYPTSQHYQQTHASNMVYSVPTFVSGPVVPTSGANESLPPLPYPRQPFPGQLPSEEPPRPPKRPASAKKLDVRIFSLLFQMMC